MDQNWPVTTDDCYMYMYMSLTANNMTANLINQFNEPDLKHPTDRQHFTGL